MTARPRPHAYRHAARWRDPSCSVRTQHLVKKLIALGERPVFEALRQVESGAPLDVVLEAFCSLQPEDYAAAGADVLPIDEWTLIEGGRR